MSDEKFDAALEAGDVAALQRIISENDPYTGAVIRSHAFDSACYHGNIAAIETLIKIGCCNFSQGLRLAAQCGNHALADFMLAHGARDVHCAMEYATSNGHLSMVRAMAALGADNWTDCMSAACSNRGATCEIVEYIWENGTAKGALSAIPIIERLHEFTSNALVHNLDIARFLMARGGKPERRYIRPALVLACETGRIEDARYIISRWICAQTKKRGVFRSMSPSLANECLTKACKSGYPEIVRLMIDGHGATHCGCRMSIDVHPRLR